MDLEPFRRLAKLKTDMKELDARKKELAAEIKNLGEALLTQMATEGVTKLPIAVEGVGEVTLYPTTRVFARPTDKELLFAALRENGLGDLVKETVSSQSLSAVYRESISEDGTPLPEAVLEQITTGEITEIAMRKS